MENRELKMPDVLDTPKEYLQEGLDNAQSKIKDTLGLTELELHREVSRLILEKEFLKATIKYQRDKIIKDAGNNG